MAPLRMPFHRFQRDLSVSQFLSTACGPNTFLEIPSNLLSKKRRTLFCPRRRPDPDLQSKEFFQKYQKSNKQSSDRIPTSNQPVPLILNWLQKHICDFSRSKDPSKPSRGGQTTEKIVSNWFYIQDGWPRSRV